MMQLALIGAAAGLLVSPLVVAAARTRLRQPVPGWHPLWIGVAAGCALAGISVATIGVWVQVVLYGAAAGLAIAAATVDVLERRLPNPLVLAVAVLGVVGLTVTTIITGSGSPLRGLAGVVILGGWWFIASLTGIGPGDVKLAAAVGFWLGWHSWSAVVLGITIGQVLASGTTLVAVIRRRRTAPLGAAVVGKVESPLGPAITGGFLAGILVTTLLTIG